jgi:hypothetical protein
MSLDHAIFVRKILSGGMSLRKWFSPFENNVVEHLLTLILNLHFSNQVSVVLMATLSVFAASLRCLTVQ